MLRKKIGAFILALSMIASIIVIPQSTTMAADGKANVSLVYLGTGTNPTSVAQALPTEAIPLNTEFWIGLQFSNLSQLRTLFKSSQTGDTGLNNFSWGVLYDSEYLTPSTSGTGATALFNKVKDNYPYDSENEEQYYRLTSINKEGSNGLAPDAETNELNAATTKSYTYLIDINPDGTAYSQNMNAVPKVFQDNVPPFAGGTVGDTPVIMAVAKFKVSKAAAGKKVLQLGLGQNIFTMGLGNEGAGEGQALAWNKSASTDVATNLKTYFEVTDKDGKKVTSYVLDLFPASPTDVLDSIAVTGDLTKLLNSYIEGNTFEPAGITVTPHKADSGNQTPIVPTNADFKGLKFYVDVAGKDASTLSTTRELTTTTGLATTDNNKHVYVSYTLDNKTAIADLGAITVAAKSLSSITNQTEGTNKTTFPSNTRTYYTGTALKDILTGASAEKLTVVKTYNNTDTEEIVYSALGDNGLALYYVDAAGKLQPVGEQTKLAEGTNTFYVAEAGKENTAVAGVTIKAGPYTVNAVTDTMILRAATGGKLKYTSDENEVDASGNHLNVIDFKDVKIKYNMASAADATPTENTVSKIGSSKLIFYIGTSENPAENTYTNDKTTIIGIPTEESSTSYTNALKNAYVYVVPAGLADYTSVTPVLVGQLKERAITEPESNPEGEKQLYPVGGTITPNTTKYGDTLSDVKDEDDPMTITVTYDNGDTKTLDYDAMKKAGITMKIVKADGTTEVVASATDQTVLTPEMNGGYVQFYYNGTLIGTSTPLTVNKKTVGYSSVANLTTPEVKKEYDGTTKLKDGDEAKVAFKINESDLVDDDLKGGKLDIDGVTYSYNSENVADADAIVASETTPATATTAGSLAVKASASGSTDAVNKFNANYVLAPLTDANKTVYEHDNVKINAKKLTVIGSKLTIPPITVQDNKADVEQTISNPLQLTTDNSNIISIKDGTTTKTDDVQLTYKYKYAAADVQTPSATNTDGTYKADKDVIISGTGANDAFVITGNDSGNYDAKNLSITGAKGTVENKKLDTITINTAPTKATYTYPDTKLDLTGIKFNLNYEGATTPTVIDLTQFLTDGGIITVTDATGQSQTITADNAAGVISLPYGETTLNITYSGKTTTTTVTTNKKPIKLSEIKFAASKPFDGKTDVEGTYTWPKNAIETDDTANVKLTFDAAFKDAAVGKNKEVTISNIALTGDAAGNYVIVNGNENDTPITTATTTTITTGVISQGTQTAPEAAPTISVDSATNNIIVGGPHGKNIEYSIDGGKTWQSDVTFKGLTKGKEYTVQARYKKTEDGNYAPSEPTASKPVTTYKNYVAIYKKNANKDSDEPAYKVYTNTESVASKTELNALLTKKISNLKEFYTDAPATIKVEYPYTLKAENVLYYTTSSSGGGGGGGSAVTITLDKTSVNGEVGNSEKVTATIKGSTATPKWTTSNEKVATVDENGNITFVGEGKATVKINVSGTVKSVAVTVTAAKATPVPTVKPTVEPTVEPTDKPSEPDTPIIDVNYTKPYASGYEDDTFKPENKITRAELAAMIARLSYGDDLPDGAYVSSFPDIEADAWFNKYVGYLEDKDVLTGYEDGTFRPYDTVTRGEIATVIARAQRYELIPYSGIFADVTDSDWAKDYIQTLASQGIISGYEDGTFGPYSPLSRAEAVTIINNVLAPSTAIVTFTPNDIEGHWAEANIILAVNERMLSGTWSEDLNPVEIPTPEVTEPVEEAAPAPEATEAPVEEAAPAPEATEAPAEEVVPEGELDPTVKDEPAVPVNPEA